MFTVHLASSNWVVDMPPVLPMRRQPGLMPPTVAGPMMPAVFLTGKIARRVALWT